MKLARLLAVLFPVMLCGALPGCARAPARLYEWGGFQGQLYEYFKADHSTYEEQLRILDAQAERARGMDATLPPGFRAHRAMLYLRLGRDGEAKQDLEAEKAAFPESAQYMDFLLKHMTSP